MLSKTECIQESKRTFSQSLQFFLAIGPFKAIYLSTHLSQSWERCWKGREIPISIGGWKMPRFSIGIQCGFHGRLRFKFLFSKLCRHDLFPHNGLNTRQTTNSTPIYTYKGGRITQTSSVNRNKLKSPKSRFFR